MDPVTLALAKNWFKEQPSTLEVRSDDPTDPEIGRMWMIRPEVLFRETFSAPDGSPWDSSVWGETTTNGAVVRDGEFVIHNKQGVGRVRSWGGTAGVCKTTLHPVVNFSDSERTIEFAIQDWPISPLDTDAHMFALCPTRPAATVFPEPNWLRVLVWTHEGVPTLSVQIRMNGEGAHTIYTGPVDATGATLGRYRLVIQDQNTVTVQRWGGYLWDTLATHTSQSIYLNFTQAYAAFEVSTRNATNIVSAGLGRIEVW